MGWYRLKKRVKGQVCPELYQEKKKELELFVKAESEGKIDLYYIMVMKVDLV